MNNSTLSLNAQETTAIVAANNTLSTAVQQPAAPAPADAEMIVTTFADDKEQAPVAAPADEKKQEEGKKTKKHRTTKHCVPDHDNKTLIVTKATSIPGSDAFNELMQQRTLFPDYRITYRTANSSDRLSVRGLSVKDMEQFIKLSTNNDEKRMAEFKLQKQLSELYRAPISYLRNWFRRNYREYWTNAKKAANA